jgi:GntR family transcriptional repressor for pyruvate dehydrogenase complex
LFPARPNLSAYLAQQVLSLIRERELQPGDRLPSASALARRFSVATPTIREALRQLQATGVIDIRHGSGIYVKRDRERLMFSNPGYGALESQTILQILDSRILIEPHLAELAAEQADDGQLEQIQMQLANCEKTLGRADEGYIRANNAFHSAIARASGNLVLAHIVESLIELYSTELHIVDPNNSLVEIRARDQGHHQVLVDAIAKGDGAGAREAMLKHLQVARTTVTPRLG